MLVQKELKNWFIWEYVEPRTPWANTLLYMEFNDNLSDSSGKGVSITWSWIGYETIGTKKCVKLTSTSWEITWPWNLMSPVGTWDFAVSFWIKPVTSNNEPCVFQACNTASPRDWCFMFMWFNSSGVTADRVLFWVEESSRTQKATTSVTCTSLIGTWHHFLFTRKDGVCYWFIDGTSVLTPYSNSITLANVGYQRILNRASNAYQCWQNTWACMSELIVEKQWWTERKIQNYYNSTKSNYWL